MLTLFILVQLAVLYGLIAFPWRLPLAFRLLLGLIITWPILSIYGEIPLPAGIPDLSYSRAAVVLLLLMVFVAGATTRRHHRVPTASAWDTANHVYRAPALNNSRAVHPAGLPSPEETGQDQETYGTSSASQRRPRLRSRFKTSIFSERGIPALIGTFVLFKGAAVMLALVTGVAETTAVADFIGSTLIPVAMYFLTKRFLISRDRLSWLMHALILAALMVFTTGIYERVLDLPETAFSIPAHNEAGDTRYLDVPGGRAAGVVGDPSVFGGIAGLGLLASLCCLMYARTLPYRLMYIALALVFCYGAFVTYTRAVWISVGFSVFLVQFNIRGLWKLTLPLFICGFLSLPVLWGLLSQNALVKDRLGNSKNVTGRIERFVWSAKQSVQYPILGRGPGELNRIMQQKFPVEGFKTSHNTYMSLLVDYGVIVFCLYLAIALRWLNQARSVLRRDADDSFEKGAVAVMAGFLVIWLLCGMSLELSYFSYFSALVWVAAATIESIAQLHGRSPPTR